MTERRHPVSPAHGRARPRSVARGWRATAAEEVRTVGVWWSSRLSQGFEWLLQLGLPTAATILEMQNVKRRVPEIGEIDQAVRSLRGPARTGPDSTASESPFEA